ncbi:type II secretion system protein N [Robbsia sp. Bb-Pol-6]|uniref:Type II secretion system protein N n=1 Tax=Robbsia betulipollinis TaxID=2981849 RepID=A0ABT3ZSD4_9BURK|nr:type II secretion system protein N [Robbsia betulipollinis]MCY0389192.1 type II secretion system protein N [Robbsia betulipollinis]
MAPTPPRDPAAVPPPPRPSRSGSWRPSLRRPSPRRRPAADALPAARIAGGAPGWRSPGGRWRAWLRVLPWLLVVCVACLATVLVLLPAAWIVPRFAAATGGRVSLVDPQGSLWHGSARLMLSAGSDAEGATVMPNRIAWTTRAWPLLSGHLRMVMREEQPQALPVLLDARWDGTTLSAGGLAVPAGLLTGLGAPFNTLDFQGDMRLDWTEWRLIGDRAYGGLVVSLRDLSSRVSLVRPLGTYRATVTAAGQEGTLVVETLSGPLTVSGDGQFRDGRMNFAGRVSSSDEARPNLAGLLNLMGRPLGDGAHALSFVR